jgi:hypothetical protein
MINPMTITATIMPMIKPKFADCEEPGVGLGVCVIGVEVEAIVGV